MSKLILLIVAAAWMAVLLPPLVRARFDGGSTSSVSDFRRQLSTLQRAQAPRAQAPMRAMARPLAPSPRQFGPGVDHFRGDRIDPRQPQARRPGRPMSSRQTPQYGRPQLVASDGILESEPRHRRSHHTAELSRHHFAAETAFMSPREVVRRRRVNVLYGLVALNALTLFLAFTTGSSAMVYLFSAALLGLAGYCYVLVQIRNQDYMRRYRGQRRAA